MPGDRKHHSEKMRRCVEQVVAKGHEESSAYAICTTSLQNSGEPIFEAAASGSDEEVRMLEARDAPEVTRELHLLGSMGTVRRETLNDRSYLVVPIIALMEGVIHAVNADTPEFVPGDVLKKAASSWIGKPVTLGHPAKGGKQCSATDSEIRKASGIGVIMKSEFDGRRLAQEAWIDEEKAKVLHPALYETLSSGKTEEVSVGAHVVANTIGSSYNGKLYKGTWLEASGDHLAFLPGGRGACSCEMGCGTFRAASHVVTEDGIVPAVAESFVALEGKSLDERISMVQQAVDKWNNQATSQPVVSPSSYAYARQVFDDRVIISVGDKTFSVPYTVTDGVVKFSSEPTEVRQAWVALQTSTTEKKDCLMCQENKPCDTCSKLKAAQERIKYEGGKYVLYSQDKTRRLAEHLTRDAAEQHQEALERILGGKGSGNFGHSGRPGQVGGSGGGGGSDSGPDEVTEMKVTRSGIGDGESLIHSYPSLSKGDGSYTGKRAPRGYYTTDGPEKSRVAAAIQKEFKSEGINPGSKGTYLDFGSLDYDDEKLVAIETRDPRVAQRIKEIAKKHGADVSYTHHKNTSDLGSDYDTHRLDITGFKGNPGKRPAKSLKHQRENSIYTIK